MRKIINKIWVVIILCIICLESLTVKSYGSTNNFTVSGENSDVKVIIGILVLSIITALVTFKRAISAKKNN